MTSPSKDKRIEHNDVKYDRITTILDYFQTPGLVDWKLDVGRKEANRISSVAMKIGTNVDEAVKADIVGGKLPKLKSQEAENCYKAYELWKKDYGINNLTVGERLFNPNLMITGEYDIKSVDTVIDIKCSSNIRENYWIQTEFYGRHIPYVTHKAILRLDKSLADYEYVKLPLSDYHWDVCLAAITLFRYFNKTE